MWNSKPFASLCNPIQYRFRVHKQTVPSNRHLSWSNMPLIDGLALSCIQSISPSTAATNIYLHPDYFVLLIPVLSLLVLFFLDVLHTLWMHASSQLFLVKLNYVGRGLSWLCGCKIGDFFHFLSALASNNQFIIKMWPGGTLHMVVGTLKISLDRLKKKTNEKVVYSRVL